MENSYTKVMIVNWKWDEDLSYPAFVPKTNHSSSSCQFSTELIWIPVVKSDSVQERSGDFTLKKRGSSNAYLIPTKVDLSYLYNRELLPDLRRDYLQCLLTSIHDRFPDQKRGEILFLFHKTDGFDASREIAASIRSLVTSAPGLESWKIKIGFFGGASGIIYESKGFLSPKLYEFRLNKKNPVGWFRNGFELQFLKQNNFLTVWKHYWYQTQSLLHGYRDIMNKLQIPGKSEEWKPQARKYTKNLLHHLHVRDDRQYEQLENEQWDFSECGDLVEWLTEQNPKFPSHEIWIGNLQKFVENETIDFSQLNKGFNELTNSFQL